jgi:trimeric autotransporter adhesin
MNRRIQFALGPVAILFLVSQPGSLMAFDAPKPEANALTSKAFFKPELRISSSNVALGEMLDALPNKSAWAGFAAAYGQPEVYVDPRSGAVTSILTRIPMIPGSGVGNEVQLKDVSAALGKTVGKVDPEVVADLVRKFIATHSAVIGIDPAQLGAARAVQVTDTLWNVRIPQAVNGIPVRFGHIVAVINSGNLILLGTETWGNARVDTKPEITEEQALSIGFAFAGGRAPWDELWEKPSLVVIPYAPPEFQAGEGFSGPVGSGYGHRLAWSFGFERKGEDGRWEVLVDAHDGEVLRFEDENLYETKEITGGVYPLSSTEICPSNDRCGTMQADYPMPWANTGLPAPNNFTNSAGLFNYTSGTVTTTFSGKYVNITDTCGPVNETASGDIVMGGTNGQHDCAVPAGTSAGNTAASRSAFYEVNKLAEQARGWLPGNAWLQSQLQTNVNINLTCNAFYSPSAGTINFYRSGGGCRNTGEIAAVFDHEWGHALDDNDSGGALSASSEGYADIAAIYRLQASCVGYGFFHTLNDGCGTTADGTGFNANESINGTHCTLDCSGVRDADWDKHADHTPDTPQNFSCTHCSSGSGPCGRQVHCDAAPTRQAAWDLVTRDLTAAPFNMPLNDAFLVGNRLFYTGSGTIGSWHACTCPSTSDGCGATNAYMSWLAADDDNGNPADGTPHMTAIHAAFNRHNMACATPTPTNSGCAGGPTTAPTLSVAVGSNSLSLSWTAVPGATSYRVFRSEGYAGCDFGKALIATVSGTSYTDPDVANGRTASYVVQAVGSHAACYGPGSACVQGTAQPCAGSISLTQELYNCGGAPLNITLIDGDLTGAGTQAVSISSNTEHGPENLVLTENPAGSGVFTGLFGTTTAPAAPGDGAISISHGDTIAVDYLDVSYCGVPNFLVSKFATVDCAVPGITNVQITNVTGNSADVTFDTTEPTNAVAHFGTTPPPGGSVTNPTLATSHTVHLSGLSGCTAYVVSVSATDPSGNTGSNDNAGAYYGFVTLANVTPSYPSTDTPKPIPDVRTPPVLSPIVVSETKTVLDVNVKINITHTFDGDLDIFLIAPNGTRVELTTDNGGTDENFVNTVFDDEAATSITTGTAPYTGSFKPEGFLSTVDGIPANGTWTLEITDDGNVDSGTLNSWELQLTFPAEPCPTVGQVTLDKASYQCTETAQIQVVDFSILGQGSQLVTVTSAAEPGGVIRNTFETPAGSGHFLGDVTLTTAPAASDGLLSVTDGDTMTVTYIDADDGFGGTNIPRTDTAAIDCSAPAIQNVLATGITGRAASLTWTTNEASSSLAHYGTTAPPSATASQAALVTSHSVPISGLTPCTPYLFDVSSTDATNNAASDDNGGVYYGFTTTADNQPSFNYAGPAVPIPDNSATGATASITLTDVKEVLDVNVLVSVAHVSAGELELFLVAPGGTQIPLALRRGGTGDNFTNTLFDDAATTSISAGTAPFTGSFKPESPLAGLNGTLSNGTWSLLAKDRAAANVGTITSWQLQLTYPAIACNVPVVQEASHSVAESCAGGSNSVVDPGDDLSIPVQVANTGYAGATNVVGTLSTTTPGVTIVDGTTSYGSLPLGGFSSGDGPFLVHVGDSVPCGTLISFQLQATGNEGSWSDSFTVRVGAQPIGQTNYPSTDTPKPIPDVRTPPVVSSIVLTDTGIVADVNVEINITHTYDGDLDIFLIAPNGTRVELTTDNGNSQANFVNTVFDDEAAVSITAGAGPFTGSFKPEGLLSTVDGIPASGTWTLEITDDANLDSGTLNSWTLTITNPAGPYECTTCSLATPGAVTELKFTAKDAISWTTAPGASDYYVYRGAPADLPSLLTTGVDSCERGQTAGSSFSGLAETPASGAFQWYLVRGHNALGYGSPGDASAGVRTQNAGGICP